MNLLSMRKCSWAMSGAFVACLTFAAHGSANVFDDAVFWFRGGKDKNNDGYIKSGEFFDDLHADDDNHANHKMSMSTSYYTGDYVDFRDNAEFRDEQVVFPALGNSAMKNMQVLHISNVAVKKYYFPFVVNPRSVFESNNISTEYTVVSRIRLDDDGINRNQCFMRLGYNTNDLARQGMWLGFTKPSSAWYAGCLRIGGYCTPDSESSDHSFLLNLPVPTNTWVDIAVVVGNGKMRVGVASPASLAIHNSNPTIAFDETPMWTENCALLSSDYYRLFCLDGQSKPKDANNADQTCFIGSVQQMAIWGRALSDQEVMSAFGMPRPALFRTGLDNGASNEFGGTRSSQSQTIDGLGSWQGVANTMRSGDAWTVRFTALRDEANLAQIFSIKSLSDSVPAQIEPILNGTSLGVKRVVPNAHVFWQVMTNLVVSGNANELLVKRKDDGAGEFKIDAMELGGALGVGKETESGTDDQRTYPNRIATGVPSAADPNTQHWPMGLQPYSGTTNLHFRVWVDPDLANKATSRFWTCTKCEAKSGSAIVGDEVSWLYVNGSKKVTRDSGTSWEEINLTFQPGELNGGWNDFEFISDTYTTCHWLLGYYRFETLLPPPPPLIVIIR